MMNYIVRSFIFLLYTILYYIMELLYIYEIINNISLTRLPYHFTCSFILLLYLSLRKSSCTIYMLSIYLTAQEMHVLILSHFYHVK